VVNVQTPKKAHRSQASSLEADYCLFKEFLYNYKDYTIAIAGEIATSWQLTKLLFHSEY
jgi:hypothetical protein